MFDKMISGRQLVFREINKPINIEYWDDNKGIRLEDPRRELQKKNEDVCLALTFVAVATRERRLIFDEHN